MSQNLKNANTIVDSLIKIKNANGGFDTIYPITKSENVKVSSNKSLAQHLLELQNVMEGFIKEDRINQPNGVVGLNDKGLIPSEFIPTEFKEIHIVENISERDALENLFKGQSVYVKDATGDDTVKRGGAYYLYDGAAWIKTAESEALDVVLDFNALINKPTTLAGYGIEDAVHVDEVTTEAAPNKILKLNEQGKLAADVQGNADTASRLQQAVNVKVDGDIVAHETTFDGSQELVIPFVLKDTGVTAGTYVKVTVNSKGQVTDAGALTPEDIPNLDWSKITTGKPTTLAGYGIEDALNIAGGTLTGALTLHGDPTESLHAATKQYVDNVVQGLDVKESVRVATTGNIADLNGLLIVDGIQLEAGDRVLVKDQDDKRQNGIYVAQAGAWVRSADANVSKNLTSGLFTFVEEGQTNANNGFVLTTAGDIVLGVTELEFSQFSGAGQVIAGVGLAKNGNTIYLSNTGVAAGQYTKVTVDAQGRVTAGEALSVDDLPELTWELIQGRPNSSVEEIDDAVAKRHSHANAETLDKLSDANGRMAFEGKELAFRDETYISAISAEAPETLSVGGLWFQVI